MPPANQAIQQVTASEVADYRVQVPKKQVIEPAIAVNRGAPMEFDEL